MSMRTRAHDIRILKTRQPLKTKFRISLLCLTLIPFTVLADGGLPSQPYIYVRGMARAEKTPDVVVLHFDLVARDPDQAKANAEVQARAGKAFALFRERKIAENDVVAEQLRSEAEFEQNQNYPSRGKLIGYVVTRQFQVKVREVSAFPKLVDELIKGVNAEFSQIEPQYSKIEEWKRELWGKAIVDARQQAENTARPAGMKVLSVFAMSPVSIPDIGPTMFPKTELEGGVVAYSRMAAQEVAPSEYRLAPISLTQTIHVIYLIGPTS